MVQIRKQEISGILNSGAASHDTEDGCQFLIVTDNGECNVFQLFCVSLPEVKQYTDSEIENMYNDLQIGTLSASVMAPGNFSIRIQGHVSFAIPNRFENFYDYIKKYTA